ncbi:tagaturonate reductase [Anaerotalea alkaliphila]|uniref:Tagaturonate reductase n=1 Tax=Anaerotalea alkaliphila TaxID=2662126 RepID=A0A7X5HYC6_9FIRM|nr:tagaturonate reductase [Anaerotalea alkaliphila]NDL68871.1 tagaturonate reductase [Anaerotalea alkaliphila]
MEKLSKALHQAPPRPIKVIQFGEGNFLRAFTDWTVQKLNDEADFNGGIAVVQPLPVGLVDLLASQDFLYTHTLKGIKNGEPVKEHLLNDSIVSAVNPYTDHAGYLGLAAVETVKIVISNTTESGIAYEPEDTLEGPQKGFPAKLTALLHARFKAFGGDPDKGFVIIPCELIDRNGDKLKEVVERHAREWQLGEAFEAWLGEANTFCNSLVDRIVPGYPRDRIQEVWEELGYEDQLVVESEQFNLWVIEGPAGLKELLPVDRTDCNVLFVEDMTPYRTRKVRILNGAHTTLVPVAYLYGIDTVKESVEHPVVGKYLAQAVYEEIIPTLDLPKEELESFAAEVMDRFRNPFISHQLLSISLNGMSKYNTRVLPSLEAYLREKGALPKRLVFSLAAMLVFYRGLRGEETIPVNDAEDILELFRKAWAAFDGSEEGCRSLARTVLAHAPVWTADLTALPGLLDLVVEYLGLILEKGMEEALQEVLL